MLPIWLGTTISTIIFTSYVTWNTYKYGILPSISDSYYKHNSKLLFFLFMFGVGAPIILMAQSGLVFFSGVLFILCGCAPAFKHNDYTFEDEIHIIGAIGGIILLTIYFMSLHNYIPLACISTIGGSFYFFDVKNKTFWFEIISFLTLILNLFEIA